MRMREETKRELIVIVAVIVAVIAIVQVARMQGVLPSDIIITPSINTTQGSPAVVTPAPSPEIQHVTVIWTGEGWEVDRIDDNVTCYVRYPESMARSTAISCISDIYIGGVRVNTSERFPGL